MENEVYNNFAQIYDTLMDDVDYKKWFNYIQKILNDKNLSPQKVLEMACGTGSFTEFLCQEGYNITCFDLSQEMLSVAYDKLRRYRNCKILKQNMIDFKLKKKYELILCLCDSINYITSSGDLKKVFKNVYDHLEDGGLFIFDINSSYKLSNLIGENTFVEDREEIFYVWENWFDSEEELCEFYLTFFVKENEKYIRFNERHVQKAYEIDEITDILRSVSFKSIDIYEGFTLEKPINESERINFVVKKD